MRRIRLRNARIATCAGVGESDEAKLDVRERASLVIENSRITYLGPDADSPSLKYAEDIDVGGRLITPGLVDPHTHLVFAGTRSNDFRAKMEGVDYRTIAQRGGGIMASVHATRAASDEALTQLVQSRLFELAQGGVTTVEVKSGYGLTLEHELRSLRIARIAGLSMRDNAQSRSHPKLAGDAMPNITTTLLGAHAVPPEYAHDRAGYIALVANEMIPGIKVNALFGRDVLPHLADACDIYLDENAFTLDEARLILTRAKHEGLHVKAHVGQFADLGGAQLVAELGGLSCDHLEQVSDEGLLAMARAGTRAVLLPVAWRTLKQRAPDAMRMRALGVNIAIGTDANPGTSPCLDLLVALGLAVRDAGLPPSAALLSVTREAALACGLKTAGRLQVGAEADVCLWDHDDPSVFGYVLGGLRPAWVARGGMRLAGSLQNLQAPVFS